VPLFLFPKHSTLQYISGHQKRWNVVSYPEMLFPTKKKYLPGEILNTSGRLDSCLDQALDSRTKNWAGRRRSWSQKIKTLNRENVHFTGQAIYQSRGLCGLVCPSRTSERGGGGYCVKEGGEKKGAREGACTGAATMPQTSN
jgi:hypothetical protein